MEYCNMDRAKVAQIWAEEMINGVTKMRGARVRNSLASRSFTPDVCRPPGRGSATILAVFPPGFGVSLAIVRL